MADHNDFGKLAEELAENYLVQKNYKILAKNYRYQKAEIDIIAQFDNQIIIVEVKARKTDAFMLPQEAINKKKIKLIVSATNNFLEQNNINLEARFDVISVLPNETGKLEINHIENAFEAFDAN
jgi:putative endonuclease